MTERDLSPTVRLIEASTHLRQARERFDGEDDELAALLAEVCTEVDVARAVVETRDDWGETRWEDGESGQP